MKLTDLRNLINEEIQYVLNEAVARPSMAGRNVQIAPLKPSDKPGGRSIPNQINISRFILRKFGKDIYIKEKGKILALYISEALYKYVNGETKGKGRLADIFATIDPSKASSLRAIFKTADPKGKQGQGKVNDEEADIETTGMYLTGVPILKSTPEDITVARPTKDSKIINPETGKPITRENLINEVMNALQQEEAPHKPIDVIGKLYQVKLADGKMTKEEMVCEVTVFDEIISEETSGVFKNPSEARRHANEILKEYDDKLEEVKAAMEDYRKNKAENDKLKEEAKNKINGIKGPHNKK